MGWLGTTLGGAAVTLGTASGVTEGSADGSTVGLTSAVGVTEGSAEGAAVGLESADLLGAGVSLLVVRTWRPPCWTCENVVPRPPDRACPLAAS
jgi:hypothetical protein